MSNHPPPARSEGPEITSEQLKAWAAGEAEKQEAWALLDDKQALSADAAEIAASRRSRAAHYRAVVALVEKHEELKRLVTEGRIWADLDKNGKNMLDFLHVWLDQAKAENARLTHDLDTCTRERDEAEAGEMAVTKRGAAISRLLSAVEGEWPYLTALAEAHWRTDSAQYFTSHHASVVDHLSARFAELRRAQTGDLTT